MNFVDMYFELLLLNICTFLSGAFCAKDMVNMRQGMHCKFKHILYYFNSFVPNKREIAEKLQEQNDRRHICIIFAL